MTDRIAGIFLLYMTKFGKNLVMDQICDRFTDSGSKKSETIDIFAEEPAGCRFWGEK